MPSRKKAKGKARKAKKQAAENDLAVGSSCCHLAENCPPVVLNVCLNLVKEIEIEVYNAEAEAVGVNKFSTNRLLRIIMRLYFEYYHAIFDDDRKKAACRQILLSRGTEALLYSGRDPSSLPEADVLNAMPYLVMLVHMEVVEKFNGVFHPLHDTSEIILKTHCELNDKVACPREIVRYFHRHNSCACLKEMYYYLKDNTKRTTFCVECNKVKNIREMMVCSRCNIANYCSDECASAHYAHHKTVCKRLRKVEAGAKIVLWAEEVSSAMAKMDLRESEE